MKWLRALKIYQWNTHTHKAYDHEPGFGRDIGYTDRSNTTPPLQRTNCPPHSHLSFVVFSLLCPNDWLETPSWDSKGHWGLCETYAFGRGYLYVNFCQFSSLHLEVDLSSGTSGSYPLTLNGILSPGRRGSVGPWSALLVSSIECSNIRIQIFYFLNRYFLLLSLIGM